MVVPMVHAISSDAVLQAVRYIGRPCPYGHPGLRYTYNSSCVDCTLEKNRSNKARKVQNRERWRTKNHHRMKEIRARQYKNNPTPRKLGAIRRRAMKVKAPGHFYQSDIDSLLDKQKEICAAPHCNTSLSITFHIDHRKPLSRGGSNWPKNLQLLCPFCNDSKGSKTMEEWAKWLSR